MSAIHDLGAAIERALEECPVADVLSILTGSLVGLTVELVRRQGEDINKPITLNGGDQRDITISPPKAAQRAAAQAVPSNHDALRCVVGNCKFNGEVDRHAQNCTAAQVQALATNPHQIAEPACWCQVCRPITWDDMRMVFCPTCGNKRCPRANDHRNLCTGSNEPGQPGSAYPSSPQKDQS